MAQYNHLPIFQLAYQLTLEIHRRTHHFPREHKYALGQHLKELAASILDRIVMANSEQNKSPVLKDARQRLERLRIHIRLSYDLKIINLKGYECLSRQLEDLSKQLSGWHEWSLKSEHMKQSQA